MWSFTCRMISETCYTAVFSFHLRTRKGLFRHKTEWKFGSRLLICELALKFETQVETYLSKAFSLGIFTSFRLFVASFCEYALISVPAKLPYNSICIVGQGQWFTSRTQSRRKILRPQNAIINFNNVLSQLFFQFKDLVVILMVCA